MRYTIVLLGLMACSEPPVPTEVWTAQDHAQPPRQEVDPNRVARRPAPQEPQGDQRVEAAATLWRLSCAGCHGVEGRGDGSEYPGALMDMTEGHWQASVTDEAIARAITLGKPPMPAFGEVIAPAGIAALVEHVRRLGAAAPGAAAPGAAAPGAAAPGAEPVEGPEAAEAPSP